MPGPPTLKEIQNWLNEAYNDHLSTFLYDDHVRLTNGSAAHYVDIYRPDEQSFTLEGERYGETITKSCDASRESLLETLSKTI